MLSNVFLHYVLDDWFERDVQPRLKGHSFLIRFELENFLDLLLVFRL